MKRPSVGRIAVDAFFDNFTFGALFGKLRIPGSPQVLIDPCSNTFVMEASLEIGIWTMRPLGGEQLVKIVSLRDSLVAKALRKCMMRSNPVDRLSDQLLTSIARGKANPAHRQSDPSLKQPDSLHVSR